MKEVENKRWTNEASEGTRKLALLEAARLQQLADAGCFDRGQLTVDIEQESFIIDARTGKPLPVEEFILDNSVGVRPDTTVYTVEYDANGVTLVSDEGIVNLLNAFREKNRSIQKAISEVTGGNGILVPLGTSPLVGIIDWDDFLIKDKKRQMRYKLLNAATFRENPVRPMRIRNPITGEEMKDIASNLSAMTRCAATQVHIAYPTIGETLEAYNISIALAGPLIALFSNSPFAAGIDTGLASARMEMLTQAEQKRSGLAITATSVFEHFATTLNTCLPPFIELSDKKRALELAYGATHMSTRLRLDEEKGTSRIEIRFLDSATPYRAVQALVFLLTVIEGLRERPIFSSFAESKKNFTEGRKGIEGEMQLRSGSVPTQAFLLGLIEVALRESKKFGFETSKEMLMLLKDEIIRRETQADNMRRSVEIMQAEGFSREEALGMFQKIRSQAAIA